jgi:uncharacterized protein (UPF0147 family)
MKIIELLNKIANGEEVPKKITQYCKCFDEIKYWKLCARGYGCYEADDDIEEYLFDYLTTDMLNDEIEIIEEDKKIEKFKIDDELVDEKAVLTDIGLQRNIIKLANKINEIIDYINRGEK